MPIPQLGDFLLPLTMGRNIPMMHMDFNGYRNLGLRNSLTKQSGAVMHRYIRRVSHRFPTQVGKPQVIKQGKFCPKTDGLI